MHLNAMHSRKGLYSANRASSHRYCSSYTQRRKLSWGKWLSYTCWHSRETIVPIPSTSEQHPPPSTQAEAPSSAANGSMVQSHPTLSCGIQLPKFKLPTFNGSPHQWPPFWEQYQAAVHSKPQLNDTAKLLYLRASLEGTAAALISRVPYQVHHIR